MNVYTMPGVADMGMVWMGAGQPNPEMTMDLISGEHHSEMLMDQEASPYYPPSVNSISSQSIEDINTMHASQMTETMALPSESMDNMDMIHFMDQMGKNGNDNESDYGQEDDEEVDYESHPYMITTSTQTVPLSARKIKPIKHPGLILKTPIAYQSDTDPSVIPIQKDGIAVCEKCGAIGVKHAFYTRQRRFCSMACARGYSGLIPEPLPTHSQQSPEAQDYAKHKFIARSDENFSGTITDQPLPQLPPPPPPPPPSMPLPPLMEESVPLIRRKPAELANSYDWDAQLHDDTFVAAPVTCFRHAPMTDIWEHIMVGMKVEVENTDCDNVSEAFPDSFWVATVLKIIGYKALLRYEGFGSNDTKDFWVSLCSNQVHSVGYCATRGKPLIPPKTIEDKYLDWKDFLRKRLTGARTLPSNFSNKAIESIKSRFRTGLHLEVVDKNRISQVKVAIVHKIVGKRLNVKYFDLPDDAGFWCHEDSPLLHPVGWAKKVGHHIVAPVSYMERVSVGIGDDDDATDDLFTPLQIGSRDRFSENFFSIGMKLEAIDPLNLSSVCVATIMDVLRHGYIMIRIDSYESDLTGADWFCYHVKSPCIFPLGFCEGYDIPLTPPRGWDANNFHWPRYLRETQNIAACKELFHLSVPQHGFLPGMKIEAADLMDPRLVCVATVAKVAGRLLKVHFDGWEDEYDQWLDCESPDIYPVGWCQSVGHKLEGPPAVVKAAPPTVKQTKGMKKRGRKKKVISPQKPAALPVKMIKEELVFVDVEKMEVPEDNQGPEAGQEPAGPDQTLPTSSDANPPPERKATSYINSNNASTKFIPRLVDSSGGNNDTGDLCPEEWNVFDVAQFLRVNEYANFCDSFSKQKVDGKILMNLSKEDVLEYTGCKVGPSLKIYDLIQKLKMKVNAAQNRHMKSNLKSFL